MRLYDRTRAWLNREVIEAHSIDMRQFMDFRQATLPNGVHIVEAYNSSGLTFTILPDRGLDIWLAHYNGIPLTWISQASPHLPDFGQSWLRQFNAGLLTTCGLTHVGPPETDPETGELRDIHGLYARLRANDVVTQGGWTDEQYHLTLSGTVTEASLFGEQLRLSRTYRMTLGEPAISVSDIITNLADVPVPLMLLYHINLGYPLTAQGAKLHIAHKAVYPRDAEARNGYDTWADYNAATPGFPEQVFYHKVKVGNDNRAMAAMLHEDFGICLDWDTTHLPYFTQWKNTRQGIYVNGIEPGNCIPEGRTAACENGRLVMLEPGESRRFSWRLAILDGESAIKKQKTAISELQRTGTTVADCKLDDYA